MDLIRGQAYIGSIPFITSEGISLACWNFFKHKNTTGRGLIVTLSHLDDGMLNDDVYCDHNDNRDRVHD